jgi:hypothetical protein
MMAETENTSGRIKCCKTCHRYGKWLIDYCSIRCFSSDSFGVLLFSSIILLSLSFLLTGIDLEAFIIISRVFLLVGALSLLVGIYGFYLNAFDKIKTTEDGILESIELKSDDRLSRYKKCPNCNSYALKEFSKCTYCHYKWRKDNSPFFFYFFTY